MQGYYSKATSNLYDYLKFKVNADTSKNLVDVQTFIKDYANPNGRPDIHGKSILHEICEYSNNSVGGKNRTTLPEIFRFILHQKNVRLDIPNQDGEMLIHYAATMKRTSEFLHILLFESADARSKIDILSTTGDTALHFACAMKDSPIENIQYLLNAGANPNIISRKNTVPLYDAIFNQNDESRLTSMIIALLDKGADPNIKSAGGCTALHIACICRRSAYICNLLLEAGADPEIENDKGKTSQDIAIQEELGINFQRWIDIIREWKMGAFVQSMHPRLGNLSHAGKLSREHHEMIYRQMRKDSHPGRLSKEHHDMIYNRLRGILP